jgi:hypothetical protein
MAFLERADDARDWLGSIGIGFRIFEYSKESRGGTRMGMCMPHVAFLLFVGLDWGWLYLPLELRWLDWIGLNQESRLELMGRD